MRPSNALFSDMPGPKEAYSKWWGDRHGVATKQRGVIQYSLSPFQSKVMPGYAKKFVFNGYRRLSAEAFYFLIPFATGYGIYTWARSYDDYHNSKAGHIAALAAGEESSH